jgi:2-polyprenyl-3-methyl-5-hydroxy-6-metoxy-1,4-benzoquinol methylase
MGGSVWQCEWCHYGEGMTPNGCPLCSSSTEQWFRLERGLILRCSNRSECGLGFLSEQPSAEQLAAFYEEYYYPEHGGRGVFENSTRSKSEQHLLALDDRVGLRGKRMLDYGCGVGSFLEVARQHDLMVEGVEFDDVGRATAQAEGFRVEKSIECFGPESLDFVYMNDVIEHLRDPVSDLGAIRSRLRPSSAIFVVTMNMKGITPRLRGAKWGVITNPTHLWFYDETSLKRTLEMAGFARIEVQRWPVVFEHHGIPRRLSQRALQAAGLDGSLRMLAWRE